MVSNSAAQANLKCVQVGLRQRYHLGLDEGHRDGLQAILGPQTGPVSWLHRAGPVWCTWCMQHLPKPAMYAMCRPALYAPTPHAVCSIHQTGSICCTSWCMMPVVCGTGLRPTGSSMDQIIGPLGTPCLREEKKEGDTGSLRKDSGVIPQTGNCKKHPIFSCK